MAPVRLRHPKGVSTIQVAFDDNAYTVAQLQQEIYSVTNILPSRQILKSGYPPKSLTIVPELPLQSLGLQKGDQIIVGEDSSASGSSRPTGSAAAAGASSPPRAAANAPSRSSTSSAPAPRAPAPAPAPRSAAPAHAPAPAQPKLSGPASVEVDGSFLIHRVVPDDNSCLFSSIALVFEQSISKASQIRKLAAQGILSNPSLYTPAILGMPPAEYISTISKPTSWGGAIELAVLAAHYNTEIASVDVESGRIDRFTPPLNEDEDGAGGVVKMRCILIYSGIHYDAASLAPMVDAPDEWHQTLFEVRSSSSDQDPILTAAKKLADILRAKKAFTNTATFDLKCEECGQGLKGEKGARVHAEQTGHVRFGEY